MIRRLLWRLRGGRKPFSKQTYMEHAAYGEAFAAFMYAENPELSADAVRAYKWAEAQFIRIARGRVGEHDLVG